VNGGLNAGDLIVISGIDVPVEGMTVRVNENAQSETTKADSRLNRQKIGNLPACSPGLLPIRWQPIC
jgi:hypothetical protein